ncbi:MAG: hypothetical protein ACT4QE_10365 [Anaerolineales bacterium]
MSDNLALVDANSFETHPRAFNAEERASLISILPSGARERLDFRFHGNDIP